MSARNSILDYTEPWGLQLTASLLLSELYENTSETDLQPSDPVCFGRRRDLWGIKPSRELDRSHGNLFSRSPIMSNYLLVFITTPVKPPSGERRTFFTLLPRFLK
jgi:hypothetical protein